jgi:hypothetical protein
MIRHSAIITAVVSLLVLGAMTNAASARVFFHHHWRGGPWVAPALIWGPPVYAYAGCHVRPERVWTPWGWRWRRVEVCD